jgi:hypothetical protein
VNALRVPVLAGFLVGVVALAGCGKKGDPLPPLRPVPASIIDLRATRTGDQIRLEFTVPATNVDGTSPPAIDRVDIYARRAEADAPDVPAGAIAGDEDNFVVRLPVRPSAGAQAQAGPTDPSGVSTLVPAPGEPAVFVDRVGARDGDVVTYVAVPVAGSGRGRPGPPSNLVRVPLGELPLAPTDLEATYDSTDTRLTWSPAESGDRFRVLERDADGDWAELGAEPIAEASFTTPVVFEKERCFAVQSVRVAEHVTVEGAVSAPACLTAVDTYPPPAPASLVLLQEGADVTIMWDAVAAGDLAGYIVLRGDGPDGALAPLFETPLAATMFRDATVETGATYSYAIQAVDSSPAANASAVSPREVIAVR